MTCLPLALSFLAAGAAHLDQAEHAYAEARYDRALKILEALVQEDLSAGERLRAYELLAFTHAAFNETEPAIDAFAHALVLDPGYQPGPGTSPKIRALFEKARSPPPPAPESRATPPTPPAPPPKAVRDLGTATPPAAPHEGGLLSRWWFWTAVGVVAVAGGATAWAVSQSPSGTLGAGKLP